MPVCTSQPPMTLSDQLAGREAAMHDGEQDVLAARRELVGDLGVAAPMFQV